MLFDFYDIETVVDTLIKSSAGVYFFQSDPDPDGLQRKYPLVGIYEDRIFPAASLAIALRHYGVSFDDVEIVPGEHISFDLPEPDEHGRSRISIPINDKGQMQVNWAGNWQDKETGEFDLVHYPYNVLKDFQESEYSNYILAEFKKLMNLSFDGNVKAAYKPAIGYIDAPKSDIKKAVQQVMRMGMMEKWMAANPNATAQDFPQKVPAFVFNELKNNNIIANAFLDQDRSEDPTLDQLISDGSLIYDLGLDDYEFTTYRQHIIDLNNEIEKNGENRKVLVKARGYAKNTERNWTQVV